MLDGEFLQGDSSGVASKCDVASKDAIRNLHGKGKKVKKKYKSVKAFTKRHKSESVWIVAKVEALEDGIDFFCVFASKKDTRVQGGPFFHIFVCFKSKLHCQGFKPGQKRLLWRGYAL